MYEIDPALLIIAGLMWLGYGVMLYRKHKKAAQWTSVPGTIIESSISEITIKLTPGMRFNLKYEYRVDDRSYTGSRLTLVDTMDYPATASNRTTVENLVAQYPVGKNVQVYFNPNDPQQSFLYKGFGTVPYICMAVGIGIIIYAIIK